MEEITNEIAMLSKEKWKPFFDARVNSNNKNLYVSHYITDKSEVCLEVLDASSSTVKFAGIFETIEASLTYLKTNVLDEHAFHELEGLILSQRAQ